VQVDLPRLGTAAVLCDLPDGALRPLGLREPGEADVEARGGEGDGGRAADAAVAACDDRGWLDRGSAREGDPR
jgi:hypothetical protein